MAKTSTNTKTSKTQPSLQDRLKEIGEELKTVAIDSPKYRKLMLELDQLLGTEENPRDLEIEENWERSK